MKIRRQYSFQSEVATSSLNDIMFFLLLFFLIISTVTNPNVIKVLLPKSDASQSLNKQSVMLTITADHRYYIDKQEVPANQLEAELLKACSTMSEPTVVLRIPYSFSVQEMVDVLKIGHKNKLKVVLATQKV